MSGSGSDLEGARGLALLCDHAGVVQRIMRDEAGLTEPSLVGRSLLQLVDDSSRDKARHFLAEVVTSEAAFDWELGIRGTDDVRLYHFAAAVVSAAEIIVVAATTRSAVLQYYDDLMRINNEQANALRSALKLRAVEADATRDAEVYDRMMRLNNELATVQRELTRKNVELQRVNQLKNQFVGMAAHDLRNPIGAIRSLSSLLLDEELPLSPEKGREFLRRIVASSEFMLALIDDLLDISAIESGQLRLDAQPVNVVEVVRGVVELNRLLADEKRIAIRLEVAPDVPVVVADARKMEQVLQNLLGNAVKFSPLQSTVRVAVRPERDGVLLEVTDEGPGIPAGEVAQIFAPFRRGTPRGTAGERSTGLGLAIAKRVVDGHGGRLACESVVGSGSTFSAWLPRTPDIARGASRPVRDATDRTDAAGR